MSTKSNGFNLARTICAAMLALAVCITCATTALADYVYTDFPVGDENGDAAFASVNVTNLQNWIVTGNVTSSNLTIGVTGQPVAMVTIESGGSWTANSLIMGHGADTLGTLNITGTGVLTTTSTSYVGRSGGGEAVINISGNSQFNHSGGIFHLGYTAAGETVTINQSGGAASFLGGTFNIANVAGTTATYSISGGSAYYGSHLNIGLADKTSSGRFEVIGSVATSIETATRLLVNDTLAYTIDAGGVTAIKTDYLAFRLLSTLELTVTDLAHISIGQEFDLINFDRFLSGSTPVGDINLVNAGIGGVQWTLQVVNPVGGTGGIIQAVVTAVPEPTTMALLGLGLVGLISRRRRR